MAYKARPCSVAINAVTAILLLLSLHRNHGIRIVPRRRAGTHCRRVEPNREHLFTDTVLRGPNGCRTWSTWSCPTCTRTFPARPFWAADCPRTRRSPSSCSCTASNIPSSTRTAWWTAPRATSRYSRSICRENGHAGSAAIWCGTHVWISPETSTLSDTLCTYLRRRPSEQTIVGFNNNDNNIQYIYV